MGQSYPYVLVNGKIGNLLSAIGNAAKPSRFSYEFLKQIGFGSSNDRGFVSLFRHLGLITENGVPTSAFDEIRDETQRPYALGDAIKQGYPELFSVNTSIHRATDADIKAAISRTTGKDAEYVTRAANTFKALISLAKFDRPSTTSAAVKPVGPVPDAPDADGSITVPEQVDPVQFNQTASRIPSLNYNIEIHLPATTDVSVYNAIFKSLRDTLGIY